MEIFNPEEENWLREMEAEREKYWNISRETAQFLTGIIFDRHLPRGLEIGMSNGYSGIWLGRALEKNGGKLDSVESHAERFNLAKENFKKFNLLKTITMIKGHAPEILEADSALRDRVFDFIFLDATKMEYIQYFKALWDRLEKGGVLVADNVTSHSGAVADFLAEVKNRKDLNAKLVEIGTGLLVINKG